MKDTVSVQDFIENGLIHTEIEFADLAPQLIQFQEYERKRISRELHDDIGQRLALVTSDVAAMVERNSAFSASTESLKGLLIALDGLCKDVHDMAHGLHSYKLELLGLQPALKDLCRQFSKSPFQALLETHDFEEPASKEISLCLYRIAQEALSNTFRHAKSPLAVVTLTKIRNVFQLTIEDFGVGFDVRHSPYGLGLLSMNERVKLVGGQVEISSRPGRGTEITVVIPDNTNMKSS
jgi:signal transduction histidine kinase